MISKYIKGFLKVVGSFSKIGRYNLWMYLIFTGSISFLVAGAIFYVGYMSGDTIGDWIVSLYPFDWGSGFVDKAADILGGSLVVLSGLVIYKYILLAITSPIMSFVSEKVEYELTGKRVEGFSIKRAIGELIRGISISIQNLIKELGLILILFVFGLILPFAAPIIAVLSFLVQAYFAGYANLDYYMERRFSIYESNQTAKMHKWGIMGIGSSFLLILLIPVLGWVFAPLLSTIAATEYAIEERI